MSTLLNWLLIAIGIGGMFLILIAPTKPATSWPPSCSRFA